MTRLLLVCHAEIGEALCAVASTILDRPVEPGLIAVGPNTDADEVLEQIAFEIRQLCRQDPPLVLTDLPGATPHNLAAEAIERLCPEAPLVTGVNLPMLLRALTHLDRPAVELAAMAVEGARAAIAARPQR
ncbi:MAG: PTS sugar transporter subunit IIA [Wenzhouxiangellaceae bacterium]